MAIDCELETIISFADARSAFPGSDRRLSLATLHRWRLKGVRQVRLETVLVGGLRYTSREAIARFIAAQNANDAPATPVITASQRRQQAEAARTELDKVCSGRGRTMARPRKHSIGTIGGPHKSP